MSWPPARTPPPVDGDATPRAAGAERGQALAAAAAARSLGRVERLQQAQQHVALGGIAAARAPPIRPPSAGSFSAQ